MPWSHRGTMGINFGGFSHNSNIFNMVFMSSYLYYFGIEWTLHSCRDGNRCPKLKLFCLIMSCSQYLSCLFTVTIVMFNMWNSKTYCRFLRHILPSWGCRATVCTVSFFFFPYSLQFRSCSTTQARITFPLSIIGTRPLLSSRESPRGQLIMDLNAAHYPDKAGAVAGQWLPDWLDDSHTVLTGRQR